MIKKMIITPHFIGRKPWSKRPQQKQTERLLAKVKQFHYRPTGFQDVEDPSDIMTIGTWGF